MYTHNINYLLQKIFTSKDVLSFDEIYYKKYIYLKKYINKIYNYVNDKSLYSKNDIIQESWLNIWLQITDKHVVIRSEKEFDLFLMDVVNNTISELNR